jgi:hypothetical protein
MKTNIYLCVLTNGETYDDYEDYTITVTGKDLEEAKKNAIIKYNDTFDNDFYERNIRNGGGLDITLEYEDVTLNAK